MFVKRPPTPANTLYEKVFTKCSLITLYTLFAFHMSFVVSSVFVAVHKYNGSGWQTHRKFLDIYCPKLELEII